MPPVAQFTEKEENSSMYVKRVLPNGVRLISEKLDTVRTVSVGIWVGNGSR